MSSDSTEVTRVLTDAEFDEVSGGNVADGVLRAATQWYRDNTFKMGFGFELWQDLYCPKS